MIGGRGFSSSLNMSPKLPIEISLLPLYQTTLYRQWLYMVCPKNNSCICCVVPLHHGPQCCMIQHTCKFTDMRYNWNNCATPEAADLVLFSRFFHENIEIDLSQIPFRPLLTSCMIRWICIYKSGRCNKIFRGKKCAFLQLSLSL